MNVRTLPWFNLGNPTGNAVTSKEAIEAAGLDWNVEKRKVYTLNGQGNKILVKDTFALVRDTDDEVLGTVKGRYVPFQNTEAFSFTDSIVQSGEALYESAGALKGGKLVYLAMKLPEPIMIGGEDEHEMYILLRTAHNGGGAVNVFMTPIRTKCTNVLSLAPHTAVQRMSMPHVGSLTGKLEEARLTLSATGKYIAEFDQMAQSLMQAKLDKDQAYDILSDILPIRPKTEEKIEAILDWYESSDKNGYKGTGWGLVNAITEFHEHGVEHRAPEARFWTAIDGYVNTWRNAAASRILG